MLMGRSAGWVKLSYRSNIIMGTEKDGDGYGEAKAEEQSQRSPKLTMKPTTCHCKNQKKISNQEITGSNQYAPVVFYSGRIFTYFKMIRGREITGGEAEGCPRPRNRELPWQQRQDLGSQVLPAARPSWAQTQTQLPEEQAAGITLLLP